MDFDYKESKKRIIDILSSKTEIKEVDKIPSDESNFTYENGIRSRVGSIFIDIINSSELFKENNSEKVARIMRAFCSEIIDILRKNDNYRQIGIRGDCIYAIYSITNKSDLHAILDDAILINTFQKMFNKLLDKNSFPTFSIGIGLGASKDLIVKAGKKGTGISDYIWIGSAVVNASKLSSQGNRDSFEPIVMDSTFYSNIKEFKANKDHMYSHYFSKKQSNKLDEYVYHADMINCEYDNWINGGMK